MSASARPASMSPLAGVPLSGPRQGFQDLLGIAADALAIWPPFYVNSILGSPRSWLPPFDYYSEFTIIDLWRLARTVKYLANVTVPSLPRAPEPLFPPFLRDLFWHPTVVLQRPDHYGSYNSYPDEHWFFINGIMTDDEVAQINAACLTYLFHRPITLIQNSTDSLLLDLLECSLGKRWFLNTESARVAFPAVYDALKSKVRRVVVVCHSQGTIIMAVILRGLKSIPTRAAQPALTAAPAGSAVVSGAAPLASASAGTAAPPPAHASRLPDDGPSAAITLTPVLPAGAGGAAAQPAAAPGAPAGALGTLAPNYAGPEQIFPDEMGLDLGDFEPLTEEEWAKLEIYCFANCATEMTYAAYRARDGRPLPWIESFGNQYDIVARLGMLAPHPERWSIALDGPCYERLAAWGHLLDEHYLLPIAKGQKRGRKAGGGGAGACPFQLLNPESYPAAATPRLYRYINGGVPPD